MTHEGVKRMADMAFGDKVSAVVHGKFMIGQHGQMQIMSGVCSGDRMALTDDHEAMSATVIVLIHKRGSLPQDVSPEDFLENVQAYDISRPVTG